MDSVHHIAHQSTIKNVQKYEKMKKDITVNIFRGKTRNILPLLPSEYFDFIYVDGSHYYDEISFDLKEALRLVKSAGVICGDDLEVLPTAPIVEVLKHHKNQDIFNLEGDIWVHPGVALALYESGLSIEIENGHWRMLKI